MTATCARSRHVQVELHLLLTVFPEPYRVPWTARMKGASFGWH